MPVSRLCVNLQANVASMRGKLHGLMPVEGATRVPLMERPHGVKISVVYIKEGRRLLGYYNAEGKGYHRHFMNRKEEYRFPDIWKVHYDVLTFEIAI
jgi:hypothetical protein